MEVTAAASAVPTEQDQPDTIEPYSVEAGSADAGRRALDRASRWLVPAIFALYAVIALYAFWPVWPGDPSRLPTCACGDLANAVWYLRWTPFALLHGHNPLYSNWIDYPRGVNLAQNTLMPLLGFLGAPLTLTAGPVATFNLLAWLAIPISATACFAMLRRFVHNMPAAIMGGLLYGASPYMVGQSWGHLNLTFVPIPPLMALLVHDLLIRKSPSTIRSGLLLGILAAAQLLISPEILLSTGIMMLAGLGILALLQRSKAHEKVGRALRGLGAAAVSFLVLAAYPIYFQLAGPHHYAGPPQGRMNYSADLLGTIVPTLNERFAPAHWSTVGEKFVLHSQVENGSYLGIPLLVILVAIVVWQRRSLMVRFSAAMATFSWVLSLGPKLVVDAHSTGIPMPFALLDRLPLFPDLIPARLSLYTDLFAAMIVAHAVAELLKRSQEARRAQSANVDTPRAAGIVLAGLLALAVVVPLVPKWPYPSYPAVAPRLFAARSALAIPEGSVVLTYPYPAYPENQAMLWQAESSMRFKLLGGYALRPQRNRAATSVPFEGAAADLARLLIADYTTAGRRAPIEDPQSRTASLACAMLRRYHVSTVVLQWSGAHPQNAERLLRSVLGTNPDHLGNVLVWPAVQRDITSSRGCRR